MTLRVLPPVDFYLCVNCGTLVQFERGTPPAGFGLDFCDPCDQADLDMTIARQAEAVDDLRASVLSPRLGPDDDVRGYSPHIDTDTILTGPEWHALTTGPDGFRWLDDDEPDDLADREATVIYLERAR